MARDLASRNAERNRRIEDARAVDMHRHGLLRGERAQPRQVAERKDRAARAVMRGLDTYQRGRELVGAELPAQTLANLIEIGRAAPRRNRAVEQTRERCDAAHFAAHDVAVAVEQHLAAAPGMGEQRDQVGHGAARDEQRRLLADERCGSFLQPPHRRIALARVIAERGSAHGFAHLLRR